MGLFDKVKNFYRGDDDDFDENVEEEIGEEIDFVSRRDDSSDAAHKSNKVVKPEKFDDASTIADHLNAKRTVVLNLENANKDVARRILDFLSGVAYANDGQIKKVANCTFIITPYNVGIMGDLLDELENNGLYF